MSIVWLICRFGFMISRLGFMISRLRFMIRRLGFMICRFRRVVGWSWFMILWLIESKYIF